MPRLGDILLRSKQLTESQLHTAVAEQQRWGGLLGEILLRMDYISEPVLVDALTRQMGVMAAESKLLHQPEASAVRRLTLEAAKKLRAVPLQIREKGKLMVVAMCEPQNLLLLDELRKTTGCRITPFLIGPLTLISLLNEHYGAQEVQEEQEPSEGSFKMLDSLGRTVLKGPAEAEKLLSAAANLRTLSVPPQVAAERPPSAAAAELLAQLEASQRQEVAALRAMVELLIERGVFTRDEYLARVRR